MATYQFESMTSAQALAYNAASDQLRFATGVTAADVGVFGSSGSYSLSVGDHTLQFGAGLTGDVHGVFSDGSRLVLGTPGADDLSGTAGRDQLRGGDGDDVFHASGGRDVIDGGAGTDTLTFEGASAGASLSLAFAAFGEGPGQITGVENLVGAAFADTLSGQTSDNVIEGGDGGDFLSGFGGADTIDGGRGQDLLSGGDGPDDFIIRQGDSPVTAPDVITDWSSEDQFQLGVGTGAYQEASAPDNGRAYANTLIAAGARYVAMQTPQGVILYIDSAANGGVAEDAVLLSGRTLDDISARNVSAYTTLATAPMGPADPSPSPIVIPSASSQPPTSDPTPTPSGPVTGGPGPDTLIGTSGADTLLGKGGDDVISGGGGNDRLDGGDGTDTLSYAAAANAVSVTLNADTPVSGGGAEGQDINLNFERLVGSAYGDRLVGSVGADTIHGGDGGDTINGNVGRDALYGDAGDDRITGGVALYGGDGNDTLGSINEAGPSLLDGGAGNDGLYGTYPDDTLMGGEGADTISGGHGHDELYGGPGADTFKFDNGQSLSANPDVIHDWEHADRLVFQSGQLPLTYLEASAPDMASALALATSKMASNEANFVVLQVGGDVVIYVDTGSNNQPIDAVVLAGRTLTDVDVANFTGTAEAGPVPPPPPTSSGRIAYGSSGVVSGDMDHAHLAPLGDAIITGADEYGVDAEAGDIHLYLRGTGFALDSAGHLAGGQVTNISLGYGAAHGGPFQVGLSVQPVTLTTLAVDLLNDDAQGFFATIFAADDNLRGGAGADLIRGLTGNDTLDGLGGQDTLFGGAGNDVIFANQLGDGLSPPPASTYLRGEDGNDYIKGGAGFDDINGNQGADTATGAGGDDWVVGGKDSDLLYGDDGNDLVYGNLGADTCYGGNGNDIVRGGQDNDVVQGNAGDDFVSGDKGDDTMSGGAGADIFHTFGDAGIDRVLDFRISEGDRVMVDPGTKYTVSQVGADTVISMTGGGQMILVSVQLSDLSGAWIFGA